MKDTKHYHVITIGCQMNKSDSERIAGYLEARGWRLAPERKKAGLVIITTCGVRQSTEDRIFGLIPGIKKDNRKAKIVLTGCLSARADIRKKLKGAVDVWLPITELEFLEEKLLGKERPAGSLSGYLSVAPKYSGAVSAFIPVGNGCDNFCSYCVVPYARGREVYRSAVDIANEASELVKRGYKEITLIAQNVNSYRSILEKDLKVVSQTYKKGERIDFSTLLKIIDSLEGDFWLRFSTSHPKDMSSELIKTVAGSKKICHHIHLPVQAGDDLVLKKMNRRYTARHYLFLLKKIRRVLPDASITTDIIVGFPGETKKQFARTAALSRAAKFDMAYISRYSPRPGTAAARLAEDVLPLEKKRREEELMKILRKTALANNKKYLGQEVRVLLEKKGHSGVWLGRTGTGKVVKLKTRKKLLLGSFITVKITAAQDFGLSGALA